MRYSIHNIDYSENGKDVGGYVDFLRERIGSDMDHHEDLINVPFDTTTLQDIQAFVEDTKSPKLKYVFVVGIGGSILGPQAIHNALQAGDGTEVFWLDAIDSRKLEKAHHIIDSLQDKEELAIVISSKSGGTFETLVNSGDVLSFAEEKFKNIYDRVAVVTDQDSQLDIWAMDHNIERFHIPHMVGGRFSVFTAIGLLPLSLLGYDIADILSGAQEAVQKFSEDSFAIESAKAIYASYKNGKDILGSFMFRLEFEDMGKWYRQLIAESLGKERDIENNTVHVGITPTVLIGSVDLHSVEQLYVGGSRDKIVMFVSHERESDIKIAEHSISKKINYTHGKKIESANRAILEGTHEVYKQENLPFINVEFEEPLGREIGYYMQSLMIQVMTLGHLMNINAFNQPHVESQKMHTREILRKS